MGIKGQFFTKKGHFKLLNIHGKNTVEINKYIFLMSQLQHFLRESQNIYRLHYFCQIRFSLFRPGIHLPLSLVFQQFQNCSRTFEGFHPQCIHHSNTWDFSSHHTHPTRMKNIMELQVFKQIFLNTNSPKNEY